MSRRILEEEKILRMVQFSEKISKKYFGPKLVRPLNFEFYFHIFDCQSRQPATKFNYHVVMEKSKFVVKPLQINFRYHHHNHYHHHHHHPTS